MSELNNLKWTDLVSPTMKSDEYLKKFELKKEIIDNHKTYEPNSEFVGELNNILRDKSLKLKILAIGASWCPDCYRQIPRLIKIVEVLNSSELDFRILYGVKVNPLRKKSGIAWHKKRSPPEALDPKFDLVKIPTFYFFNSTGEFLGRIIEKPKENSTLEEELLEILSVNT